jgi:hypothetical protein
MRSLHSTTRLSNWMILLATAVTLSACVGGDPEDEPTAPFAELSADGKISIDTSALGRPLLLMITFSTGTSADVTNPLRSRIVRFEEDVAAGAVVMKEMSDAGGPGVDDRTLATFPATKRANALEFDFNAGATDLHVEFAVHEWWKQPTEFVIPLEDAEIRSIELEDGVLFLDRGAIAQVPDAGPVPVTLKYGLREYTRNPEFTPRPNNEVTGYYVNTPVAGPQGDPVSYAHRHDLSEPITYFITADTPPERKLDIEVSIAYWNRIFSDLGLGEPLTVAELPAGVQPLHPGRNVITWLPNPEDGAGRALNTTDPLTGQIVKSTVLVTSVFAALGADTANTVWMKTALDQGTEPTPLPPEIEARAVSDYYINTYTHEIGHGLGLRHNFAGSLAATTDPGAPVEPFADYLAADVAEGLLPSSSVMEYVESPLAILVGAHIRLGRAPLPYDVEAIRSMYTDEAPTFGLYCEAESSSLYLDCAEFDHGTHTIVGTYAQWQGALDDLSFQLARAVKLGGQLSAADPQVDALIVDAYLTKLAAHLSPDAQYLALRAKYPTDWAQSDQAAYAADVLAHQQQGFAELAGDRAAFVQDLVQGGLSAERVAELAATVRTRMEAYLVTVGASVDAAEMDAYFTALAAAMTAEIEPLNQAMYANVAP